MIVRSLRVEGWRCFATATTVGPFDERLNVIHAPNGSGKSTLFEALVRALMDNHSVSGRDVEALRPWGRTLAPQVVVEFAQGEAEYRLTKRFLDKPMAELARREGDAFVPLEQGARADERARAILSKSAPGRGLSRAEHWGVAQALWAPQGELGLAKPSGDLVAQIRATLGAEVAQGAAGPIERAIETLYEGFYSPVSGRLRTGQQAPPVVRIERELEAATARVVDAEARHGAFARASQRIVELRAAGEHARLVAAAVRSELDATRARSEARVALVADRAEREERARASAAQHRLLRAQVDEVRAARDELEALRRRRGESEDELASLERDERPRANEAVAAARAALEGLDRERDGHEAREREARDAASWHDARSRAEARTARLAEGCVTLEFEPGARVEVLEGERLDGPTVRVRGAPEVRVRLEGVGVVRAIVPAADERALDALRLSRADLERERDAALASVRALEQAWPSFATRAPDADALARAARAARDAHEQRARTARAALTAAERADAKLRERAGVAAARIDETTRAIAALEARIARHATEGRTDAQREDDLERALLEHEGARARLRQIDATLLAAGPDPRTEVSRLEDRLLAADEHVRATLADEKTEEGRLEHLAEAGPWSALARAMEDRARLTDELRREKLRADAVKLLRTTVAACRAEAVAAVSAPVEQSATRIFHRIAGARLGGVGVGGSFEPARVSPENAAGAPVALEQLSGGEREQVQLATRLALADVLARTERQLVVLDDVLVATDEARLARVLGVLEELSVERLQVLVLTCHPERWRALRGARFHALGG